MQGSKSVLPWLGLGAVALVLIASQLPGCRLVAPRCDDEKRDLLTWLATLQDEGTAMAPELVPGQDVLLTPDPDSIPRIDLIIKPLPEVDHRPFFVMTVGPGDQVFCQDEPEAGSDAKKCLDLLYQRARMQGYTEEQAAVGQSPAVPPGGLGRAGVRLMLGVDKSGKWSTIVRTVRLAAEVGFTEVAFLFAQESTLTAPKVLYEKEQYDVTAMGWWSSLTKNRYWMDVGAMAGAALRGCGYTGDNSFALDWTTVIPACPCGTDFEEIKVAAWLRYARQIGRPQRAVVVSIAGPAAAESVVAFDADALWKTTNKFLDLHGSKKSTPSWANVTIQDSVIDNDVPQSDGAKGKPE